MSVSLCEIRLNLDNLRHNLALLKNMGKPLMPVIKNDAYGHGMLDVAKVLWAEGISRLAVGTVAEGVELRRSGFGGTVVVLMGAVDSADLETAHKQEIVPLVHDWPGLIRVTELAGSKADSKKIRIALKVDSGMSRLGFAPDDLAAVADFLAAAPGLSPDFFISHLALAEHQDGDQYTFEQAEVFHRGLCILKAKFPDIASSLGNSACLFSFPELVGDLARPGIALYGCNPLYGSARENLGADLVPVMEVSAPVLEVRSLPRGRAIGYGCEYRAVETRNVAIVGIGYGNGYRRSAGRQAAICIHGLRAPVLGRISMQMTAVDITDLPDEVRAGDQAYVLGGPGQAVNPQEMADWWNTIPYEVTCILGKNRFPQCN